MTKQEHKFGVVALIGPPNAGKSTFLNQVVGQKVAIVTPKPQTTRNRITGILTRPGVQVLFLDTPGIHRLSGSMNRLLLESAWGALRSSDVCCLFLDVLKYTARPHVLDRDLEPIAHRLQDLPLPLFLVLNKVDALERKSMMLPLLEACGQRFPGAGIHPVSSRTGTGIETLVQEMVAALPSGPVMYPEDDLSTLPTRFLVAEIVREKLFLKLSQELPYHLAVEIENWEEEPERSLLRISALIYVSQDRYKGMVVGKQGKMLKAIGIESRKEMENMLGAKVHLELWVKVKKRWTENMSFLTGLGLGST